MQEREKGRDAATALGGKWKMWVLKVGAWPEDGVVKVAYSFPWESTNVFRKFLERNVWVCSPEQTSHSLDESLLMKILPWEILCSSSQLSTWETYVNPHELRCPNSDSVLFLTSNSETPLRLCQAVVCPYTNEFQFNFALLTASLVMFESSEEGI